MHIIYKPATNAESPSFQNGVIKTQGKGKKERHEGRICSSS
jgi:hypothetical protein